MAALVYSPSEAKAIVAGDVEVVVKEETDYPFGETISFTFDVPGNPAEVSFPFHLRIPAWCKSASVNINGDAWKKVAGDSIVKIERAWKSGDVVQLTLPMHVFRETWHENSISIQRGPLTYGLKIGEDMQMVENTNPTGSYGGESFYEVRPTSPWNYGLIQIDDDRLGEQYQVEKSSVVSAYPWNLKNAPIRIKAKAKRIPSWQLYNEMAGPLPFSITYRFEAEEAEEDITLVPYGCTQLRISQFPVVR